MQNRVARIAIYIALAALASACSKYTEGQRREATRATAEAERIAGAADVVSTTELTGATLESAEEAARDEDRERAAAIEAMRREQDSYRARLRAALTEVEHELVAKPSPSVRKRRHLLTQDLMSVDRSTAQDWATIRGRIDRDLAAGHKPESKTGR